MLQLRVETRKMQTGLVFFALSILPWVTWGYEIELKQDWTLRGESSQGKFIELKNLTAPTNVHRELQRAEIEESVLFSQNDVKQHWIARSNWSFQCSFEAPSWFFRYNMKFLTFHGLDTVTEIRLNDKVLGHTDNMFTRYSFNIANIVKVNGPNTLTIDFESPVGATFRLGGLDKLVHQPNKRDWNDKECCLNLLRKVQSSFGWDNMPIVPTIGIWKPVVIELYNTAIIRDVTYELRGSVPLAWWMFFYVHLEYGNTRRASREGTLSIQLLNTRVEVQKISTCIRFETDENGEYARTVILPVPKDAVEFWYPRGVRRHHSHHTYIALVTFEDSFSLEPTYFSQKLVKIAFRQSQVSVPADFRGQKFYFQFNNERFFAKGANLLPLHVFPELTYDRTLIKRVFEAAVQANMNLLRVWGGGYYESDEFYDLADEYGILIWQDAAFPPATYPVTEAFRRGVATELRQNIRRIQRHPSLLAWALNSEVEMALVDNRFGIFSNLSQFINEYVSLFNETVNQAFVRHSRSRSVFLTSPGYGTQNPPEKGPFFSGSPNNAEYGDNHFVVKHMTLNLWLPKSYTRARFISEFGAQSLPFRQTWQRDLAPNETLGSLVQHRQRLKNGSQFMLALIEKNLPPLDPRHRRYWEQFIYYSQISQAMQVKAQLSVYRAERGRPDSYFTMGALVWHLNDVWAAPSMSIVDSSGQFKILWYVLRDLFAEEVVLGVLGDSHLEIFLINETPLSHEYRVVMRFFRWDAIIPVYESSFLHSVTPDEPVSLAKTLKLPSLEGFTQLKLYREADSELVSTDFVFPQLFEDPERLADPRLDFKLAYHACYDSRTRTRIASIEVTVGAPAFFVFIELLNPEITTFNFSHNGFHQVEPIKTVHLKFSDPLRSCNTSITKSDLRIRHLKNFSM